MSCWTSRIQIYPSSTTRRSSSSSSRWDQGRCRTQQQQPQGRTQPHTCSSASGGEEVSRKQRKQQGQRQLLCWNPILDHRQHWTAATAAAVVAAAACRLVAPVIHPQAGLVLHKAALQACRPAEQPVDRHRISAVRLWPTLCSNSSRGVCIHNRRFRCSKHRHKRRHSLCSTSLRSTMLSCKQACKRSSNLYQCSSGLCRCRYRQLHSQRI